MRVKALLAAIGFMLSASAEGQIVFRKQSTGPGSSSTVPYTQAVNIGTGQTVTFNHNLNTQVLQPPSCQDSSGNYLGGDTATAFITDMHSTTVNQATITFSGAFTGTCTLSTGGQGPGGNGFLYRNTWSNATNYSTNDVVTYSGTSYVALQANTNQAPNSSPTYWGVVASQGATGFSAQSTTVQSDTTSARAFSSGDCGLLTLRSNAASLLADTVPQAGTAGITNGCVFRIKNTNAYGAGPVSFTPTTSTVNGAAQIWVFPNQVATIYNDGSNYFASYEGRAVLCDSWQNNTANTISTDGGTYNGIATAVTTANQDSNFGVSCNFPPNLPAGAKFSISSDISETTAAASVTARWKMKTGGGTTLWDMVATNMTSTATVQNSWQSKWWLTVTAAPSATTQVDVNVVGFGTQAFVKNVIFANNSNVYPTVDTTSAWSIKPSIQYSSTGAGFMNSIRSWHVEWENQQ